MLNTLTKHAMQQLKQHNYFQAMENNILLVIDTQTNHEMNDSTAVH